jgi:beta-carotene hydroxylase
MDVAVGVADDQDGLPPLSELGEDLLALTVPWRVAALAAPFACTALFFWLASGAWWWLAPLSLVLHTFFSYASVSHDLVHGTLRLPPRLNDVLLALVELTGLRSGHAYRATHLFHHRAFPDPDDPEGAPARMGLLRALLEGPVYLGRLWLWAWRRSPPRERAWVAAEGAVIAAYAGVAAYLWLTGRSAAPAAYGALVFLGSWLFPFVFVYVQHDATGRSPLFQTKAFRGRLVPALMLHHSYHLEHHLYPNVPARNWRELARRLDPVLEEAGVVPIRLP